MVRWVIVFVILDICNTFTSVLHLLMHHDGILESFEAYCAGEDGIHPAQGPGELGAHQGSQGHGTHPEQIVTVVIVIVLHCHCFALDWRLALVCALS